jgi:hypothetical protein
MTLGAATRDDAGRRAIQCPVSWLTTTEATRPVEAEVCDMIIAEAGEAQTNQVDWNFSRSFGRGGAAACPTSSSCGQLGSSHLRPQSGVPAWHQLEMSEEDGAHPP